MSTVLVLGASRGIGLEFVRQYREAWDRVFATARDDAGLKRIEALGAQPLRLDVTDPASIADLARQLEGEKFDIALYVAGVFSTAGATALPDPAEFDRLMRTNVLGAMQAIVHVAPKMAPGGRFIFITSDMAAIGQVDSSYGWTYRASKAGLNMAVAAAQKDYPDATLVAMSPGWVKTDMGGHSAPLTVDRSVGAMRQTIEGLTRRHRGAYLNYDGRRFKTW